LTYFRAGLLDYLRITTSGTTVETLNEFKEVARSCENNYTDASGRKLILHMKKMETTINKAVVMSTKAEGSEVATKRYCTLCKKVGHDDSYYFNNPDNPNNRLPKTEAKNMVVVNEDSVHSQGGITRKQQVERFGGTTHGETYPRPTRCHIYQAPEHLIGQCPWKERLQKFMANHMSCKLDVGINGMEIEELKGVDVDVALTRAQ
jgi:hypothetical protein